MSDENFIDNGQPWDGSTKYTVGQGQFIEASASVSPLATAATIYVDTNGTCQEFALYCMVDQVIMTIGSYKKILSSVGNYCFGGCNNPFCPGNPPPISYNLTQEELSMAKSVRSVNLSISVCGGAMTLMPSAVLEQLLPPSALEGTATITVVAPDGSPASGATVVLTDTAINQQVGSGTTNSSGVVTFSGLTVGDSFQATISYDGFGKQQASFSLNSTSYSFTVQLQCPSGYNFSNGKCVAPPSVGSQVLKGLEIVAVIAGVAGGAYIVAKVIPQRSIIEEQVRSASQAIKQNVQSTGRAIKQNINKLRGGSEQS